MRIPEHERFWAKVEVLGPDDCWRWTAATKGLKKQNKEHGHFKVWRAGAWRTRSAHILAWEYAHGAVPSGLCVCHSCDFSLCVNARHLFLGTIADNNRDMVAKRRHQYGERHWNAKLTGVQVAEIRKLAETGIVHQRIVEQFGISQAHVHRVVLGKARVLEMAG